jgi:hypothetical protein
MANKAVTVNKVVTHHARNKAATVNKAVMHPVRKVVPVDTVSRAVMASKAATVNRAVTRPVRKVVPADTALVRKVARVLVVMASKAVMANKVMHPVRKAVARVVSVARVRVDVPAALEVPVQVGVLAVPAEAAPEAPRNCWLPKSS